MTAETSVPTQDNDPVAKDKAEETDRLFRPRLSFWQFTVRAGAVVVLATGGVIAAGNVLSDVLAEKVVAGTKPAVEGKANELESKLDDFIVTATQAKCDTAEAVGIAKDIREALIEQGLIEGELMDPEQREREQEELAQQLGECAIQTEGE